MLWKSAGSGNMKRTPWPLKKDPLSTRNSDPLAMIRWRGDTRADAVHGPPLLGHGVVDSRAAPAAREPWPPTRRSPRRLPQALTRPRHAAVSKTGPDGDAGAHRRDLVVTTYAMLTRQPWLADVFILSLKAGGIWWNPAV